MTEYSRGESILKTITLTDSAGTALDLDNFDLITVKIIHKYLKSELGRYSLQDETVTTGTPAAGIITFTVKDSQTATAPLGVYEYQVKTEDTNGDPKIRVFTGDAFYITKAIT